MSTLFGRVLEAAGLNPRELMRLVNQRLAAAGHPRLAENAAYRWVKEGGVPRERHVLPVIASVLSSATGRTYAPADLWPGKTSDTMVCVAADDGLTGPWQTGETLARLRDLCAVPGPRRRMVTPVGGMNLATAVQASLSHEPSAFAARRRGAPVSPRLVDAVEQQVREARRMDDLVGGGPAAQRYVTGQLSIALDLLVHGRCDGSTAGRLLRAVADLAQTAGWMHFDGRAHGASQRYLLLALQLARAGGDQAAQANVLGMLAYQAAHSEARHAAVELGEAAVDLAKGLSAGVRARAAGRLATAYAAAGDLGGFERAADQARALLDRAPVTEAGALYYLTPRQLEAESGQGLMVLAGARPRQRDLLSRATVQLAPLARTPIDTPFRRSALLHGSYLAEALLRAGDIAGASAALRGALERLPGVESARCRHRLACLRTPLVRRRRDPDAREALGRLDRALAVA